VLLVSVALLTGATAGLVYGLTVTVNSDGYMYACYRKTNGEVRLRDKRDDCPRGFAPTRWYGASPAPAQPGPPGPPGTDGVSGYEVVSETTLVPPDRSFHVVDCPEGKVPVSGGWHDVWNDTASILTAGEIGPLSSYPTATGWAFTYWNAVSNNHEVEFYVTCADVAS
jgi:hypothetical protein